MPRFSNFVYHIVLWSIVVFWCRYSLSVPCHAAPLQEAWVGYDPSRQIRFATPAEADDKRQELINFVWSEGLPTTRLPNVTHGIEYPTDLRFVNQSLVSNVDQLNFNINVSDYQLSSISYLLSPITPAATPRLGIVHQGHQGGLGDGVNSTINYLLGQGFQVAVMQMPLIGWNSTTERRTITLPTGTPNRYNSHEMMFSSLAETLDGGMFAFFLEPVVQTVNLFVDQNPGGQDITMLGLSGGGWTTHMAAAIDTRIDLSIPVAGALPLYAPPTSRDIEQTYDPLFREIDAVPDENNLLDTADGVASWLEIFTLGGYGTGRRQIQVLNHGDTCCFAGDAFETYEQFVSDRVDTLGQGNWDFVSDVSIRRHLITKFAITNVIGPALAKRIPEPSTWVMAVLGFLSLTVRKGGRCHVLYECLSSIGY